MKKILFILISGGLVLPVFASAFDITFGNHLNADILKTTIGKIVGLIFNISLGLGPLLIIIGAVLLSTAGGNPEQAETGKKIIIYTLIGLAVVILSAGLPAILTNIMVPEGPGELDGLAWPADPQAALNQYLSNTDQIGDSFLSILNNRRNEIDELFGL